MKIIKAFKYFIINQNGWISIDDHLISKIIVHLMIHFSCLSIHTFYRTTIKPKFLNYL
jgi:hypothetical protein